MCSHYDIGNVFMGEIIFPIILLHSVFYKELINSNCTFLSSNLLDLFVSNISTNNFC